MEEAVIEKSIGLGAWIFANPPVFLAIWGFSNNSGSAALYRIENRAEIEWLKGVPR